MNKEGMKMCAYKSEKPAKQRLEEWLLLITKDTSCSNKTEECLCQDQDAFTLIRLQHRWLASRRVCALKRGVCQQGYGTSRVIPFPASPTGKHTVAVKIWILQIRKKTTSISLHIRYMEAEVSQVLKQRTSVKQPLTPKGYKTSVYKVVCCHQKEPEAW